MSEGLPQVTITTDGAARGNPGPGGWAALLEAGSKERLLSGEGPEHTTNNAMEILAVAKALSSLKRSCRVLLRIDSQYVIGGLERLQRGGALPEKNRELWAQLWKAVQPHQITIEWVRGHNGDARNERVDQAANAASNRAYLMAQPAAEIVPDHVRQWQLVLRSPSAQGPVRWVLLASQRYSGEVFPKGVTAPTAMYQALLAALQLAVTLPDAAEALVDVQTNYELLVKQGRGEWKVKQPEQARLAAQVAPLREKLAGLRFTYVPTEQVEQVLNA